MTTRCRGWSLLRRRGCGASFPTTPACRDGHREEILEFEPPHRLRYQLLPGLRFRDYIGEITIEPEGTGSRLSTSIRLRTRIPGTQFFGPIAIGIATRAAARVAESVSSPGDHSG
ncbi:SRPBCC family protein [Mycobacterium sp. NPDC003449]